MSMDPVQRFTDAQNERRARGISLSHSESLKKRQGDALAELLAGSPLKATTEEQWNAFRELNLSDLRALRDVAREKMHTQEEEIEIWSERDDSADEGVTVFAELESRAREIWVRYMSVEVTLDGLLDYALVYMDWPPPEYEKLPGGFKDTLGDSANKGTPGRRKEYDEDALEEAVWAVLKEQPNKCWHSSGPYEGQPNRNGIFDAISTSAEHQSCLKKVRGSKEGTMISDRTASDAIKEILEADPERVGEIRRSLKEKGEGR